MKYLSFRAADGSSRFGFTENDSVFDLSGNLREWTSSETKPGRVVVKGGLNSKPERGTRCAYTEDESSTYADKSLSFRCCRDADAPPVPSPAPSP